MPDGVLAKDNWTTRDRAANRRLFRLVAEVLRAIEADRDLPPEPRLALQGLPVPEPLLGVGVSGRAGA